MTDFMQQIFRELDSYAVRAKAVLASPRVHQLKQETRERLRRISSEPKGEDGRWLEDIEAIVDEDAIDDA